MSDLQITKVGQSIHATSDNKSCHCSDGKNKVNNKTDDQNIQEEESGLLSSVTNLAQKGISLLTSPFSGITGGLSLVANTLFSAFSPFLSFVNSSGEKKTVKDLTQSLLESKKSLESVKVSKPTREAINRLYETVSKIAQRGDLQDMDISELIQRWKDDPNSRILFELIQKLERGECAPFKDKKYRRSLIESLRVLEEGIRRVENTPREERTPHTETTRQELIQTADPMLDTMRLHEERGGDANFSPEDRRQVAENFSSMQHHIENILKSPAMSSCLGDFCSKLYGLLSLVKDFLMYWCLSCGESEEAKKEAERVCQERQAKIKKIDEICRRHKIKKKKAEELYSMIKSTKERLMNFLSIKNAEKLKYDVKTRKYYYAKSQVNENYNDLEYAKSKYRCVSASVDYYKNLEEQGENSLGPSYFCESNVIDLELDVHC